MKIKSIQAREILDSRGEPTIETSISLENGQTAKASVPSGASTGSKEALELRDGDLTRYKGKGVLKACENVNAKIAAELVGKEVENQQDIDQIMIDLDGTENKSNLGANAILSVSLAAARVAALSNNLPLWKYLNQISGIKLPEEILFPTPLFNVINGGAHADSKLDIQEFMIIPSGIKTFSQKLKAGSELYYELREKLLQNEYRVAIGNEGGFAPRLESNEEALRLMAEAVKQSPYKLGQEIKIGIDAAASEFFDQTAKTYNLKLDKVSLSSANIITMYREWIEKYQMELIEDPMSEFDWEGWKKFESLLGGSIVNVGDDLIVTNAKIVEKAQAEKACNAVLIKVNQIGSLTEALNCITTTRNTGMKVVVSHRSGETTDDFIADLAVGVNADYVKFGAPVRGERVAKYNRLAEIEQAIQNL